MTSMPIECVPEGALRYSPVQVANTKVVIHVLVEGAAIKVDLRTVFRAIKLAWTTGKTCARVHAEQLDISECLDRNGLETLLIDESRLATFLDRCRPAAHPTAQRRAKLLTKGWKAAISEHFPDYVRRTSVRTTKITPVSVARFQQNVKDGLSITSAAQKEKISRRAGYAIAKGAYRNQSLLAQGAFPPQTAHVTAEKPCKQGFQPHAHTTPQENIQRVPKRQISSVAELHEEICVMVQQHPLGALGVADHLRAFPCEIYRARLGKYKSWTHLIDKYNAAQERAVELTTQRPFSAEKGAAQ